MFAVKTVRIETKTNQENTFKNSGRMWNNWVTVMYYWNVPLNTALCGHLLSGVQPIVSKMAAPTVRCLLRSRLHTRTVRWEQLQIIGNRCRTQLLPSSFHFKEFDWKIQPVLHTWTASTGSADCITIDATCRGGSILQLWLFAGTSHASIPSGNPRPPMRLKKE